MTAMSETVAHAADVWPVPGSEARPLVTFAVFAYNQEDIIRDAVEGAFGQTYEPLEIIISDDCSSDETFKIIESLTEQYKGPHTIKIRKSEINMGTALHVSAVSKLMAGELMVVAAGDDISLPDRVRIIVDEWSARGRPISTIHSRVASFKGFNRDILTVSPLNFPIETKIDANWFIKNKRLPFIAPTCAYSRHIFDEFDQLIGGSIIEDGPLAFRTYLIGEFIGIDRVLVHQRYLPVSAGSGHSVKDPNRWNRLIRSRILSYANGLQDLQTCNALSSNQVRSLENDCARHIILLSKFFLPTSRPMNGVQRLVFALRIIAEYPIHSGIAHRVFFALAVNGLDDLPFVKCVRDIYRRFAKIKKSVSV